MKLRTWVRTQSEYANMKSNEFIIENKQKGTYAAVRFGEDTKKAIAEYIKENDMPNCLIMEFECVKLTARHKELMEEHDATYDFDEYKTHITFSYDIGEMDHKDLPAFTGPVDIVEEYGEDLDIDWAQNNAKENE